MMVIKIINGDCIEVMKQMPDTCISACITDPPYELSFMHKKWDGTGIAFKKETWGEIQRLLFPGGFCLAFGGTRTAHRMACAIEDAGFNINNFIGWVYGSGFPKAQDITNQMEDKEEYKGWKTPQLKPAIEPIYIAQKELDQVGSDLKPFDPFIYEKKCATKERTMDGKVNNTHPCLKPKKLLGYLMRLVCKKSAVILDPFMGSGSGALAAIDEGMSYIGIELDQEYYKIAEARIDCYVINKGYIKVINTNEIEWRKE